MNTPQREYAPPHAARGPGFLIGLVTGTCVGAGLAIWLAPRLASELRARLADSASNVGARASDALQQTGAKVGEAIDEIARRGQAVRDDVAETVARGARGVEHLATAARSSHR